MCFLSVDVGSFLTQCPVDLQSRVNKQIVSGKEVKYRDIYDPVSVDGRGLLCVKLILL